MEFLYNINVKLLRINVSLLPINRDFINRPKSSQNHFKIKITLKSLPIFKILWILKIGCHFKVILSDFEMILRWFWVIYKIAINRRWAIFTNWLTNNQSHFETPSLNIIIGYSLRMAWTPSPPTKLYTCLIYSWGKICAT